MVVFDFFRICKDANTYLLSINKLVTVAFLKNWSKNFCVLAHDVQFVDNWFSTSSINELSDN